jgi:hypothetical protein
MERLERLVSVRDRLAASIEACESGRDLPALSREYRAVLSEIAAIGTEEVSDVVDQLAERRSSKGAAGA